LVLTDNEVGMLEQLTYLDRDVANNCGISGFIGIKGSHKNMTIAQILECFDETALRTLEEKGNQAIGFISAKEWAGIIRYLKTSKMKDFNLSDTLEGYDGTTLALCFTEGGNEKDAVVAFKGTSGKDEWIDNAEGFNVADTKCQKEALDYIESLPYDTLTVTGHSKGGNKAMYTAVTSDKVVRCISYDGQGFSQEFIDKYWAEIQSKGRIITGYSLSTDYVHALLFPVPNSKQVYCQGYGVANMGEHHSPNSFFKTDKNGRIILDENGNPMVTQISEDKSITMLHGFTTFIINNASAEDKIVMIEFLSKLLATVFGDDGVNPQEIVDYILGNQDAFAMVIAYLAKYMDEYDINADEIDKLLEALGMNTLNELINITDFDAFGYHIDVNLNLANIINYIKEQLNDNDNDNILKYIILPLIKKWKAQGYDIDITTFWEKINSKVKEIETSGGRKNAVARTGIIRDFSSSVYDALMNAINRIESMGGSSVSSWNNYVGEEWYSSLFVSIMIKGINHYFLKLSETNHVCKARINEVFDNVKTIDNKSGEQLVMRCKALQQANIYIKSMTSNIIG